MNARKKKSSISDEIEKADVLRAGLDAILGNRTLSWQKSFTLVQQVNGLFIFPCVYGEKCTMTCRSLRYENM
jgi:hypothetical protein